MGLNTKPLEYNGRVKITQVKEHHRSMARDIVCGGLRNKDVAKLYDMTESQVSIIVNSPLFQAELARLEALADNAVFEVRQRTALMVPKATKVLEEVLNRAAPDEVLNPETGEFVAPPVEKDATKLGVKVALEVYDRILPKNEPRVSGDTYQTQINIATKGMTSEQLRDSVFELLRD